MTKKEMNQEIVKPMPIKFDALKIFEKKVGYSWLERKGKKFCGCCGKHESECICKVMHHNLPPKQKPRTKAGYIQNSMYYMISTVRKNILYFRYFIIWLDEEIGREHTPIKCYEVFRVGIDEDKKMSFARINTKSFMWNWDWLYGTELKVRPRFDDRYNFNAYVVGKLEKPSWLKYLDLKGHLKVNKYMRTKETMFYSTYTPVTYVKDYLENPTLVETMLKCNRIDLFAFRKTHKNVDDELMMMLRKGRKIPDKNWYDYVIGLKELRKDTKNINVLDPANFVEANKRVEKACNKIRQKNELERNIAEYNESYCKRVNKLVGVMFGNEKFIVTILPDVKAFYEEGSSMCHCVYRMGYYKHEKSYIFSVRDQENKRLETCEVSIDGKGKPFIKQCYGYGDRHTEYHKEIMQLMSSRLNDIKQLIGGRA